MSLRNRLLPISDRLGIFNTVNEHIVVIDSVLPNKTAVGPRNSDMLEFSIKLPNFKYFTMYHMYSGEKAWYTHGYGMTKQEFDDRLQEYEAMYPVTKGKIKFLSESKKYNIKLAYTYFLSETYTLLPFLEKNKIPFVFLLNPGGAFGYDNDSSDAMLKEVCSSPYFRKVIVNQLAIKEYILRNKLCDPKKLIYDFSGSVQFNKADVVDKKYYIKDKKSFDICFVSAKYSEKGVDKGYDLFIAAAKKLYSYNKDIMFHVVGGFNKDEIDVSELKDRIKFYGYLPAAELPAFYAGMDIFISPNRPFKLYKGGFDGFPLSAGAMFCGVCGFNADELHLNREFKDDEVVIVKTNATDIVSKVKYYFEHLDTLYEISKKGQKRAQYFYDLDRHISERIRLFNKICEDVNK